MLFSTTLTCLSHGPGRIVVVVVVVVVFWRGDCSDSDCDYGFHDSLAIPLAGIFSTVFFRLIYVKLAWNTSNSSVRFMTAIAQVSWIY